MIKVIIEYYNSHDEIVETEVTIKDAKRVVKCYAKPSEWISVHDIPPPFDETFEYAHFAKDKMIATWINPKGQWIHKVDHKGYTIHPTHWRQ